MDNKMKTGAILTIISGVLGIVWGIALLSITQYANWWWVDLGGGVIELVLGLFVTVAGIFALNKKTWGLGLAGAIVGIFTFFPTAIAAIVYDGLARKAATAK